MLRGAQRLLAPLLRPDADGTPLALDPEDRRLLETPVHWLARVRPGARRRSIRIAEPAASSEVPADAAVPLRTHVTGVSPAPRPDVAGHIVAGEIDWSAVRARAHRALGLPHGAGPAVSESASTGPIPRDTVERADTAERTVAATTRERHARDVAASHGETLAALPVPEAPSSVVERAPSSRVAVHVDGASDAAPPTSTMRAAPLPIDARADAPSTHAFTSAEPASGGESPHRVIDRAREHGVEHRAGPRAHIADADVACLTEPMRDDAAHAERATARTADARAGATADHPHRVSPLRTDDGARPYHDARHAHTAQLRADAGMREAELRSGPDATHVRHEAGVASAAHAAAEPALAPARAVLAALERAAPPASRGVDAPSERVRPASPPTAMEPAGAAFAEPRPIAAPASPHRPIDARHAEASHVVAPSRVADLAASARTAMEAPSRPDAAQKAAPVPRTLVRREATGTARGADARWPALPGEVAEAARSPDAWPCLPDELPQAPGASATNDEGPEPSRAHARDDARLEALRRAQQGAPWSA
jgi:hypothetical protein